MFYVGTEVEELKRKLSGAVIIWRAESAPEEFRAVAEAIEDANLVTYVPDEMRFLAECPAAVAHEALEGATVYVE